MKRRLCMFLLSGVFSFGFAETSGPCDMFHAGPFIVTLPWQLGQFLHLTLVET